MFSKQLNWARCYTKGYKDITFPLSCTPQESPLHWAFSQQNSWIDQCCNTTRTLSMEIIRWARRMGAFLHRPKKGHGRGETNTPNGIRSPKFRWTFTAYSSCVLFEGSTSTEIRAEGQDHDKAEVRRKGSAYSIKFKEVLTLRNPGYIYKTLRVNSSLNLVPQESPYLILVLALRGPKCQLSKVMLGERVTIIMQFSWRFYKQNIKPSQHTLPLRFLNLAWGLWSAISPQCCVPAQICSL